MNAESVPSPHLTRSLPPRAVELIAARFKILGEPIRLHLIMALEKGERSVGELIAAVQSTQANVSRQCQVLARAGILSRRKAGIHVYYRISDPTIFQLCDHVCGSLARQLGRDAESVQSEA